jgi:hypothetical protein
MSSFIVPAKQIKGYRCGTVQGHIQHVKEETEPCDRCVRAKTLYELDRRGLKVDVILDTLVEALSEGLTDRRVRRTVLRVGAYMEVTGEPPTKVLVKALKAYMDAQGA